MLVAPELFMIKKPTNDALDVYENTDLEDVVIKNFDTDFHNIKVVKNKVGKFLMFNETYQAGFIDTSFYSGNLPYINYFLLSCILNPKIKNILLIGMGSGKVVNDFEKLLPDLKKVDIVDIDPVVFQIAQEHFNFKQSEKIHFHIQDGRVFLRNTRTKYDVIIVDVAGNEGIPFRYMTGEFLEEAKAKLSSKGVLISNMFSSAEFTHDKNLILKSFLKTFQSVFKNVGIFRGDYSDKIFYKTFFNYDKRIIDITNALFFASDSLDPVVIARNCNDFAENFNKIGLENVHMYIKDIFQDEIYADSAKILIDDIINGKDFHLENLGIHL